MKTKQIRFPGISTATWSSALKSFFSAECGGAAGGGDVHERVAGGAGAVRVFVQVHGDGTRGDGADADDERWGRWWTWTRLHNGTKPRGPNTASVSGGGETNTANDSGTDTTTINSSGGSTLATMASPTPGSTLSGSTVTFVWNPGAGAVQYYLYIGTSLGSNDILSVSEGLNTSDTASGIPTTGIPIYVRLWTYNYTAGWQFNDYTYAASNGSPVPDLTVAIRPNGIFQQGQTGASYTITVTNVGTGVTSGIVQVNNVDVPAGLTATNISGGPTWSCTQPAGPCTRSDSLGVNTSYPGIALTVNVDIAALPSVSTTATVQGGGETNTINDFSTDNTSILQGENFIGNAFGKVITEYVNAGGRPIAKISNQYGVFPDVPPTAPYAGAANLMWSLGITAGCNTNSPYFCPDPTVPGYETSGYLYRYQMAVFVIRAWSIRMWGDPEAWKIKDPPSMTPYYADVQPTQQENVPVISKDNENNYVNHDVAGAFLYIQKMYELGFTQGCLDGLNHFCPGALPENYASLFRASHFNVAVFTVAARLAADAGCTNNCGKGNFLYNPIPYFADVPANDGYFSWIQKVVEFGGEQPSVGMMGCPNGSSYPNFKFCENNPTYRGQMAMFVVRVILRDLSF